MKILVIGGTYFVGRIFTIFAARDNEVYLLNRGNNPFDVEGITEYKADRHDAKALRELPYVDYDVVVDFCGYKKDDIKIICDNLCGSFKQYIFISTCDVYERNTGRIMKEEDPFEHRSFGGQAGDYIVGKVALEQELLSCAKEYNFTYTILRPAFIYGPYNYAPRESIYFKWIINAGQIIHPYDATGQFQMVFVYDVAKAILLVCNNEMAHNQAYNLCHNEMLDYKHFAQIMELTLDKEFEWIEMSVEEVCKKNIPLPFPLTKEETQYYDGSKIEGLGFEYTQIEEGMEITAEFFMS